MKLNTARPAEVYHNAAGALLFIAGVVIILGIITAEALYPGYSTSQNMISDLGATMPPNSIIVEPSATIFNLTMIISGLCMIISSGLIHRAFGTASVTATLVLSGTGVLGVGVFPGNYGNIHAIFALLAFFFGGLAAMMSYKVVSSPFRYFSLALGAIALGNLLLYYILGQGSPFAILSMGGLERWIAYPVVLWITGFGGYLMGRAQAGAEDIL
jgi:hypothetical membrane protein